MQDARRKIEVSLKPIVADNWQACIGLKVKEEQADFLPSNLYSIAIDIKGVPNAFMG